MENFSCKHSAVLRVDFQTLAITTFDVTTEIPADIDQFFLSFIRSSQFSEDCHLSVGDKAAVANGNSLRPAFDINQLNVSDFRKANKIQVTQFLSDFHNEPDWQDDLKDFQILLERYLQHQQALAQESFYLISKDWFEQDDSRLGETAFCFTYYILIIYVNTDQKLISVAVWRYD